MRLFTVQVDPPIAPAFWPAQYPGDVPHWHFRVAAKSEAEALAIMQRGDCAGMPMRITQPLG